MRSVSGSYGLSKRKYKIRSDLRVEGEALQLHGLGEVSLDAAFLYDEGLARGRVLHAAPHLAWRHNNDALSKMLLQYVSN